MPKFDYHAELHCLVYLQPGDGPSAYENPHHRRLFENAIRWVNAP